MKHKTRQNEIPGQTDEMDKWIQKDRNWTQLIQDNLSRGV